MYFLSESDREKLARLLSIVENIKGPGVINTPNGIFIGRPPASAGREHAAPQEKTFLARVLSCTGGPSKDQPDGRWKIAFEGVQPVIVENALTMEPAAVQFKGYAFEANNRFVPAGTNVQVSHQFIAPGTDGKPLNDDVWVRSVGQEWGDPRPNDVFGFAIDIGAGTELDADGERPGPLEIYGGTPVDPENQVTLWTVQGQDTPDKSDKLYRGVSFTFLSDLVADELDPYKLTGTALRASVDSAGHSIQIDDLGAFEINLTSPILPDGDNVWVQLSDGAPPEPEYEREEYVEPTAPFYEHIGPDFDPAGEGVTGVVEFTGDITDGTITLELETANFLIDSRGHMGLSSKSTVNKITMELPEGFVDELVRASETDSDPAGFLDEKIIGDGTWISIDFDSKSNVLIVSHIGPDTPGTDTALGGASWDGTGKALVLGNGVIAVDDTGHVTGTGTDTEAGLKVVGDETWIGLSESEGTVTIAHAEPFEADELLDTLSVVFDSAGAIATPGGLVFTRGGRYFDTAGHITSKEPDGVLDLLVQADDQWIELAANPGGGPGVANVLLSHIGPVDDESAEVTDLIVTHEVVDSSGKKLRLTVIKPKFDTKGHYIVEETPDEQTVDIALTEVTMVTDYRVDTSTKKFQKKTRTALVLEAGTESGWTDVHTGKTC